MEIAIEKKSMKLIKLLLSHPKYDVNETIVTFLVFQFNFNEKLYLYHSNHFSFYEILKNFFESDFFIFFF